MRETHLMHSVFIYFKASADERSRTLIAVNALGTTIAASTGASFSSARRTEQDTGNTQSGGHDTWLEHYQCADDETARTVLAALAKVDPTHSLLALVEGGLEGRHLEHFVDTTVCA